MAQEVRSPTISPTELFKAAEAVAQYGRRQTVTLHGKTIALVPEETGTRRVRGKRRENGFLAAYGSVPPLPQPLTDSEMTEIAAEEAAQEAARAGLTPHAGT